MKTLYLLRHAKSSWDEHGISDFDRSLNKRGKTDAPMMGQIFHQKNIKPDIIISSPAKRALTTAKTVAKEMGLAESSIQTDMRIYDQGMNNILAILQDLNGRYDTVMLVGHNPTFTEAVNYFCDYGLANMPTCALFGVTFPVEDWRIVDRDLGSFACYEWPKKYK